MPQLYKGKIFDILIQGIIGEKSNKNILLKSAQYQPVLLLLINEMNNY